MKKSVFHAATIRLPLTSGGNIILIDMLAKPGTHAEINQNIYRISADGRIVWQIQSDAKHDERQPYTEVRFDEAGALKAYCWNSFEYEVNLDSGEISSPKFAK